MKVQTKILILLLGVWSFFLATVAAFVFKQRQEASLYYQDFRDKTVLAFDTTIELMGDSLRVYAFDYTYWDEMVDFVEAQETDTTWGEENIKESLSSYKADVAWVFTPDFSLRYHVVSLDEPLQKTVPFDIAKVKSLFAKNKFCHFFVPTGEGLLEVRGASIHPTADDARETRPRGFYVVGRLWDETFIEQISKVTRTDIGLASPGKAVPVESSTDFREGIIRFSRSLTGEEGNAVARLDVKRDNPVIKDLNAASIRQMGIHFLFGGVLLVVLSFFLVKWVGRPLKEIAHSLNKEDPQALLWMKKQRSEFGHIARLIIQFFEQKRALGREISFRKQAETALEEEKELLFVTLRSVTEGVIATNLEGNMILMNKTAEDMTGWKIEDVYGKNFSEVVQLLDQKTHLPAENPVAKVLQSPAKLVYRDQHVLLSSSGKERRIAECAAPLRNKVSETIGVIFVFRDITMEKKIEQEMIKSSKLETVALLASGIAHDFNNLLMGITGSVSLAKLEVASGNEKLRQHLDNIEKAGLQAKKLTSQLLTFASGGAPILKTASLAELVRETTDFVLRGSNVQCRYDIDEKLWAVEIDEGQITQVIHNIVINACQAMPEGGVIHIKAENSSEGPDDVIPKLMKKFVKISIQDEGSGIREEHLRRIFDPFFTTKTKGSGLGLATAYSIVKNHDGFISVSSQLGKGTVFCLYLPAVEGAKIHKDKLEKGPVMGSGRVLIVDDEPMIREVASEMLRRLGYEPDGAADGETAIKKYMESKEKGKPYDVLLMDLTIPGGMGGMETLQRLTAIEPGVKAIVSSGYSSDPIMSEYKKFGFKGVIAKPYLIQDLGRMLHDVIKGEKFAA